MGQTACKCPEPERGSLPQEIAESAIIGHLKTVKDWLGDGKLVNAADQNGDTLLSIAARYGWFKIIEDLSKFQSLHLNSHHPIEEASYTPLWLASSEGHLECVKLLLGLNLTCRIDMIGSKMKDISAVMIAAERCNWDIVDEFLKVRDSLTSEEANYIFPRAARDLQWSAGQRALINSTCFDLSILRNFLDKALENNQQKVVSTILKMNFRHRNESLNKVLTKAVSDRNWEWVTQILKILPISASFDRTLVEAALSEMEVEVARLQKENTYDFATLNGNLLVIAAGGTTDAIARKLFSLTTYTQYAIENTLYIAAMTGHVEFIQIMFTKESRYRFTYHTLSRAHKAARKGNYFNIERLLSRILDKEAEILAENYFADK